MTLKQRKQEGMALIWIVFIFLAEYQEIWGMRRFMDFFVVDVFSLPAIFQVTGSENTSTTILNFFKNYTNARKTRRHDLNMDSFHLFGLNIKKYGV